MADHLTVRELTGVVTALRFMTPKVQVVSPTATAGVAEVAIELAISAAESGLSVALVDLDVVNPSVHEYFGLSLGPGYSSVATGAVQLSAALEVDEQLGLSVLPAGPPVPSLEELVLREESELVIRALLKRADLVLLCSPSFESEAGYSALGLADVSVVVVDEIVPAEAVVTPALVELEASVIASIADPAGALFAARNGKNTAAVEAPPEAPKTAAPAPEPAPPPPVSTPQPVQTAHPVATTQPVVGKSPPPAEVAPPPAPVEAPPLEPSPRTFVAAPPPPRVRSYLDEFPDAFREVDDEFANPAATPVAEAPAAAVAPEPVVATPAAPVVPEPVVAAPAAPATPVVPEPVVAAPAAPVTPVVPEPVVAAPAVPVTSVVPKPPASETVTPAAAPADSSKAAAAEHSAEPGVAEIVPQTNDSAAVVRPEVTNEGDGLVSWSDYRAAEPLPQVKVTDAEPLLPTDAAPTGEKLPLSLAEPRWGIATGEHPEVPSAPSGGATDDDGTDTDEAVTRALAYLDQYDVAEPTAAEAAPASGAALDGASDFESLVPEDYLAGDAPTAASEDAVASAETKADADGETWDHLRSTTVVTEHHGLYRTKKAAPGRGHTNAGAAAADTNDDDAVATDTSPVSEPAAPSDARLPVEPARQWSDIIEPDTPLPSALMPTDVPLPPPVAAIDIDQAGAGVEPGTQPSPARGLRGVAAAFSRLVGSGSDLPPSDEPPSPPGPDAPQTPADLAATETRPRTLADTMPIADPLLGGAVEADRENDESSSPASSQPVMKRTPAPIIRRPDPERQGNGSDEEVAKLATLVPGSGGAFARAATGDADTGSPSSGDEKASAGGKTSTDAKSDPADGEKTPAVSEATEGDDAEATLDTAEDDETAAIKPVPSGAAKPPAPQPAESSSGSSSTLFDYATSDDDDSPIAEKTSGARAKADQSTSAPDDDADDVDDSAKPPVERPTDPVKSFSPVPPGAGVTKKTAKSAESKSNSKSTDNRPTAGRSPSGDTSASKPSKSSGAGDGDRWVPPSKPGGAARKLPRPVVIPPSRLRPATTKNPIAHDGSDSSGDGATNNGATDEPPSDTTTDSGKKSSVGPAPSSAPTVDKTEKSPPPTPTPEDADKPETDDHGIEADGLEDASDKVAEPELKARDQSGSNGNASQQSNGSKASARATARANADLLAAAQQRASRPKPSLAEPGPEALTLWAPPVLQRSTDRVETRWFEDPVAITQRSPD